MGLKNREEMFRCLKQYRQLKTMPNSLINILVSKKIYKHTQLQTVGQGREAGERARLGRPVHQREDRRAQVSVFLRAMLQRRENCRVKVRRLF